MERIPKQWLKYIMSYGAVNVKNIVKFYVPTWSIFAGPVTYNSGFIAAVT